MAILTGFLSNQWRVFIGSTDKWRIRLQRGVGTLDPVDVTVADSTVHGIGGNGTLWTLTLQFARRTLSIADVAVTGNDVVEVQKGLQSSDFSVAGNTITSGVESADGNSWDLTLGTPISALEEGASGVSVFNTIITGTENIALQPFLQQIRDILRIGVTAEDLPDETISDLVFLRKAELDVYDRTGISEATYDTRAAADTALRDRFRISTMYRTAALLVPALPDIVRESFQSELRQYVQMDWEQKINFFLTQADDAIEEDIPDSDQGTLGRIGSSYTPPINYYV